MTVSIDARTQRFSSALQPEPDVCCLHTTEGMSWPGYSGGGEAPHATIEAIPGVGIRVREHIDPTMYAKALMNLPGGVETNRRGVLQYELMGTCDPKHKGDPAWYYWPDADDVVLAALADYLRPILKRFLIPHTAPAFLPYPASYGSARGQRFSFAQWTAFNGICGHQHVPENDHGDPGAFPIGRLIAALNGDSTPTPAAPAETDEDIMADITLTNPATKAPASLGTGLNSMWAYIFLLYKQLAALSDKLGAKVEVDEAAIAAALAPMLVSTIKTGAVELSDADIAEIAKAVSDEQARRLATP